MPWIFPTCSIKTSSGSFLILIIIIVTLITGCEIKQQSQNEALKDEISSREVKKVSEADLLQSARELGDSIASASQKALASSLMAAIKRGGIPEAIGFCNLEASGIVDSLIETFAVDIKRTTLKARNPADKPTDLEKQILEAYHYNQENNLSLSVNVQETSNGQILFTKPIVIDKELCLNCHGETGKNIPEDVHRIIQENYPDDQATGYEIGDLRGMWSITIPKKVILENL